MDSKTNSLTAIGANLSRYRQQHGLTLTGLSEMCGIAKSTLSQLENNEGNPTVETLWSIAQALNISFGQLVEEAYGGTVELVDEGVTVRLIEKTSGSPEIEVFSMELEPKARKLSAPHAKGVIERVSVLSGTMQVGGCDRPRLLQAGDSYTFEADTPHLYAANDKKCRAMVFIEYPSKAYFDTGFSTVIDWPASDADWQSLSAVLIRAAIEVNHGLQARIIRFRKHVAHLKSQEKLWNKLAEFKQQSFRWPLMLLLANDSSGLFVALFPLSATNAFNRVPNNDPESLTPLERNALLLSQLAESPCLAINKLQLNQLVQWLQDDSLTIRTLATEVLLQRNHLQLPPKLMSVMPGKMAVTPEVRDQAVDFSSRIDVDQYDAYELLHPAYARQVVAMAEDLKEFAGMSESTAVIDVGSGPGIPLLMLHELFPATRFLAIEPDDMAFAYLQRNTQAYPQIEAQRAGFLEFATVPASVDVISSVGASHHFNTAFMLQKAYELLKPSGVFSIADEFLPEFVDKESRELALVQHHIAYILNSMAGIGDREMQFDGADAERYRNIKRTLIMANLAAKEGKTPQALNLCRNLYKQLRAGGIEQRPEHELGFFVRFYWLELQAMVAGFDYEVEMKTTVPRFIELAHLAGFELLRQRRVMATSGRGEQSGGTHVLILKKPESTQWPQ